MGYFAFVFLVVIASKKIKKRLMKDASYIKESLIDSVSMLAFWAVIKLGLDLIVGFVTSLATYWMRILLFLILGRLVSIVAAYLETTPKENG